MEKVIALRAWREFASQIEALRRTHGIRSIGDDTIKNKVLFRGQSDSRFGLKSTLERYSPNKWDVKSYGELTLRSALAIESFTNSDHKLPGISEFRNSTEKSSDPFALRSIVDPLYHYWVYLRHHGFPSPLLDWSASPFVAAYFALSEKNDAEFASVYFYVEMPNGGKSGVSGMPEINTLGPYTKSHKRHFLQQAQYTIATRWEDGVFDLVSHNDVFDLEIESQDLLVRIDIPRKDRIEALVELDNYNINDYSLFHSEESLIKSIAFKEIEKRPYLED